MAFRIWTPLLSAAPVKGHLDDLGLIVLGENQVVVNVGLRDAHQVQLLDGGPNGLVALEHIDHSVHHVLGQLVIGGVGVGMVGRIVAGGGPGNHGDGGGDDILLGHLPPHIRDHRQHDSQAQPDGGGDADQEPVFHQGVDNVVQSDYIIVVLLHDSLLSQVWAESSALFRLPKGRRRFLPFLPPFSGSGAGPAAGTGAVSVPCPLAGRLTGGAQGLGFGRRCPQGRRGRRQMGGRDGSSSSGPAGPQWRLPRPQSGSGCRRRA